MTMSSIAQRIRFSSIGARHVVVGAEDVEVALSPGSPA